MEKATRLTSELGKQLNIPVIAGSDTHQAVQYGCIYTEVEEEINTVDDLYERMQKGSFEIHVAGQAAFQVKTAGLLKRALKEIHALGGDYVRVLTGAKQ